MTPPVVLLNVSAIPVAVVRRHVKPFELPRVVPECCGLAWKAVRAQNAKAGRNVAIYWDGSIRLEAGVELQGPFAEDGEVVRSATPVGSAASTTHFGPYGDLGAAHVAIQEWCAKHNHRLTGPQWEMTFIKEPLVQLQIEAERAGLMECRADAASLPGSPCEGSRVG